MSRENRTISPKLLDKLRQARVLLDGCIAGLEGQTSRRPKRSVPTRSRKSHTAAPLDFDANERAFMKVHARGLSGPKKFVLFVAFLAKGKVGVEVELKEVEKHWSRMNGLLNGSFNRFYSNSAKDNGWVNTKKQGVYVLTPRWQSALIQSK